MNYLKQRKSITGKLDALLSRGAHEENEQVRWLRAQLADVDRVMLLEELDRVTRLKQYRSEGKTEAERLGADAWLWDALNRPR